MSTSQDQPSRLLSEPVGPTLLRLAAPVTLGIAALFLFNAVDALYIGRLGANELAAISFTFPVTFMVISLAVGIGMGMTATISRAIGEGEAERGRRLTTDGLILGGMLTAIVAPAGVLFSGPLFEVLGASPDVLPLIAEYTDPWFAGSGLVVFPVLCNAALRASGDTKTPSQAFLLSGVANAVLDPLLIFGLGPVPALGMAGAAYATLASWVLSSGVSFWVLHRRERQVALPPPSLAAFRSSAEAILRIGVPAATTNVLVPVGAAIVTRLAAEHGQFAVAAYGIGTRVEFLAQVGVFALGTAMNPLAAQNFGAGRIDRLRQAVRAGALYSIAWGAVMAVILAITAPWLAMLFNDDPRVIEIATRFLRTLPVSYGFVGTAIVISSVFNAIDRPLKSATVILTRVFGLCVPMAYAGNALAGLPGLFVGVTLGNFVVGWVALAMVRREIGMLEALPAAVTRLPEPG